MLRDTPLRPHPSIAVRQETAAKMLDISVTTFLKMVAEKKLPDGRKYSSGVKLWNVGELDAATRSDAHVGGGWDDV